MNYQSAIFMPGPTELVIILVICVMLFGAGKIPHVLRDVGKSIREFRKSVKPELEGVEEDLKDIGKELKGE